MWKPHKMRAWAAACCAVRGQLSGGEGQPLRIICRQIQTAKYKQTAETDTQQWRGSSDGPWGEGQPLKIKIANTNTDTQQTLRGGARWGNVQPSFIAKGWRDEKFCPCQRRLVSPKDLLTGWAGQGRGLNEVEWRCIWAAPSFSFYCAPSNCDCDRGILASIYWEQWSTENFKGTLVRLHQKLQTR